MTTPVAGVDRAITASMQAWIGGLTAWQQVVGRFWSAVQEGAHVEAGDVIGGDSRAEASFLGAAGPLSTTEFTGCDGTRAVIGADRIHLAPCRLGAGGFATIVVSAAYTDDHPDGSYLGHVVDAAGTRTLVRLCINRAAANRATHT